MEKLKRLSDFESNELSDFQMSLFKGSNGQCTGGGFETVWLDDGNGGQCSSHTISWDSDANVEVSPGVWTTRYHNEQISIGSCW
jgi:hypothetical protein